MSEKTYLGDGCYASFDGFAITLTTENGIETTNRVYLEPEVYIALVRYRNRMVGALEPARPNGPAAGGEKGGAL